VLRRKRGRLCCGKENEQRHSVLHELGEHTFNDVVKGEASCFSPREARTVYFPLDDLNDRLPMTQLLDLPSELLTEILSLLPAQDLSSFSQATSEAHDFVESPANAVLWRTVYLFLYDDPRLTGWRIKPYDPEKEVIDWKADTKRVTRAVIYIRSVRLPCFVIAAFA
jgi:hypothetical protein